MKRIGFFITFLAFLAFVLPSLPAQDGKKDADKTDKKDDTVKDQKKDEKKDPDKKDDKTKKPEPKKAPEKLIYGNKILTKIISLGDGSSREFTVEKQELDPKKVQDMQIWQAQRMVQLTQQQFQAARNTDPKARFNAMATYQRDYNNYLIDAAKRQSNLYSPKPMEVRGSETAKVRTLLPPVEFDELGFQKKWTKKELEERKDKTGLPGYAVDFDALKTGQYVEIYLAKQAPMPKTPAKKKGPDDDDPPPAKSSAEFVLIVILQDGK